MFLWMVWDREIESYVSGANRKDTFFSTYSGAKRYCSFRHGKDWMQSFPGRFEIRKFGLIEVK